MVTLPDRRIADTFVIKYLGQSQIWLTYSHYDICRTVFGAESDMADIFSL